MKFVCLHGDDERIFYIDPAKVVMVYSSRHGTSVAFSETHSLRVLETPEEVCNLLAGGVQRE